MKKRLLVIDVLNVARACFHVVPENMTGPDGRPVNALKGFLSCVGAAIGQIAPDELILAAEGRRNWRKDLFPAYKGTRGPTPPTFKPQIGMIREVAAAAGWTWVEPENGEADDLLGAAVRQNPDKRIYLYTSDKDAKGLVSESVSMLVRKNDGGGGLGEIGPDEVLERHGIVPAQFTDYLGLIGDTTDNIPGVAGIGPETAAKLLKRYGSADGIYTHLAELGSGVRNKLEAGRENFRLSRELVALNCQIPLPSEAPMPGPENSARLSEALAKYGIHMSPLRLLGRGWAPETVPAREEGAVAAQAELF